MVENSVVSGIDLVKGKVGYKPVTVLRDTGSSTVFVNSNLVVQDDRTGNIKEITLANGSRRQCPEVIIDIHTPFISGKVLALVLDTPFADIIGGNYVNTFIPKQTECENPTVNSITEVSTDNKVVQEGSTIVKTPVLVNTEH